MVPPYNTAVIGLGLMGRRMLTSLAAHPDFTPLAGLDLDPTALAAAAAEFDLSPHDGLPALLARDDLDLVYVATPPASHLPLAREILAAGHPLFLEKPLSNDLEGAEELLRLADHAPVPSALNFPFATLPGLPRIERELASGEAGAPLRVEIQLHFSQWPRSWHHAGPWLAGGDEGGFLREVFSHFAYLTQRLLAPLRVLHADLTRPPGGVETRVLADLVAGSVPVTLIAGTGGAAPDHNCWTLYGERRSYRLEDWSLVSSSDGEAWQPLPLEPDESRGAETQLDQLAALLRGEPSCLPSLREGLDVMRVVEGLLAAG